MPDINDTLRERHETHGNFTDNATYSQAIKRIFHTSPGWHDFDEVQQEALDYYACKIARILSTRGRNIDDWHDIAGYSSLVERWLKGEVL